MPDYMGANVRDIEQVRTYVYTWSEVRVYVRSMSVGCACMFVVLVVCMIARYVHVQLALPSVR